jgi:UDP-glucuronate decarboxylase
MIICGWILAAQKPTGMPYLFLMILLLRKQLLFLKYCRGFNLVEKIVFEDVVKILASLEDEVFMDNDVLVTGGAGFLGSWLCDCLIELKAKVYCLDNFSTGKISNVEHLQTDPNFKLINKNVCDFRTDLEFDYIFHLASHASPLEYQRHPIETLKASSIGSYRMVELARSCDAALMFTSTSEVYGDAQQIPTPESYWGYVNPVGPRSCYDEGKRFTEALLMAYHREYGLDVKIARIFNTYGPRIRADGMYGRVVSRFITQALTNKPITVFGEGTQTRSFCYVSDTILGLLLITASKNTCGTVINLGNIHEIFILNLAQMIKTLTNSSSKITFHPLPKDDPKRRCPEIIKAEQLLGWKPRNDLKYGLVKTISWFQTALLSSKANAITS